MKKPDNSVNQNSTKSSDTQASDPKMQKAYELAAFLVRDRLVQEGADNLEILNDMASDDIIVVQGQYDQIHLVLQLSKIPFTHIIPEDLRNMQLRPDQTIFVNCTGYFDPDIARKLAGFVAEGGQLITTDWCLQSVLESAFPQTVVYNKTPSRDEVVRIEIVDQTDPILKGFLDEEAAPQWWLEGSSYPIKILDTEKVSVLIKSKELGDRYGEDAVMIRFEHGSGVVYHMISHFYLQRTETRDAKHKEKASVYAMSKGSSLKTQKMFEEAAEELDMNFGEVQSANTSAEFISRAFISHKKKFK